MIPIRTSAASFIGDGTSLSSISAAVPLRTTASARLSSDSSSEVVSWCRTVRYAAVATHVTARPTATVTSRATRAASVPRNLIRGPRGGVGGASGVVGWSSALLEHVPDASDGVDQPTLALGLGLAPEIPHVDLQGVRRGRE